MICQFGAWNREHVLRHVMDTHRLRSLDGIVVHLIITINVPVVYMARDVMIFMRAILYPLGSLEGVGPEIETLYMALLISKLFCRKGRLGWGGGERVRKVKFRLSTRSVRM